MTTDRRKFFRNLGAGAAGLTLGTSAISFTSGTSTHVKDEDGQILYIGDNIAVAETSNEK